MANVPSPSDAASEAPAADSPGFRVVHSPSLRDWLLTERLSLGFSTYQSAKLFLVGVGPTGRLSVFERTFMRCMGLWSDTQSLWLAASFQLWRLENGLVGADPQGYDRVYIPQIGYTTGDIDVHDVVVTRDGRPVFVNTLFSCLATVSERRSFEPLWQPPFLSRLAAGDHCHLNGLALRDGQPRYVTACGPTDTPGGWRERRHDGGCVIDIETNEFLLTGLSMPHSPRWHDGKLWLLNSGHGQLGYLDATRGRFEPVAFCPGYARGLAFHGPWAIVGLSRPREQTFRGLALDAQLAQRNQEAWCGLLVYDLRTGEPVHSLRIEGAVTELYDVIALPGVRRPKALGFKTDEIRHYVHFEVDGQPTSWTAVKPEADKPSAESK